MPAPIIASAKASPMTTAPTMRGLKPSALSVAYSLMRSRAVIAMVFAATAMMIRMTT